MILNILLIPYHLFLSCILADFLEVKRRKDLLFFPLGREYTHECSGVCMSTLTFLCMWRQRLMLVASSNFSTSIFSDKVLTQSEACHFSYTHWSESFLDPPIYTLKARVTDIYLAVWVLGIQTHALMLAQ